MIYSKDRRYGAMFINPVLDEQVEQFSFLDDRGYEIIAVVPETEALGAYAILRRRSRIASWVVGTFLACILVLVAGWLALHGR